MNNRWKPTLGEQYYVADPTRSAWCDEYQWFNTYIDNIFLERGLVFQTKEEAIRKSKEMCGIYVIDGVEYRRGEWVKVSDDNIGWNIRKFVRGSSNKIVTIAGESNEIKLKKLNIKYHWDWLYIRKLQQPTVKEVTMQEVCDKFAGRQNPKQSR